MVKILQANFRVFIRVFCTSAAQGTRTGTGQIGLMCIDHEALSRENVAFLRVAQTYQCWCQWKWKQKSKTASSIFEKKTRHNRKWRTMDKSHEAKSWSGFWRQQHTPIWDRSCLENEFCFCFVFIFWLCLFCGWILATLFNKKYNCLRALFVSMGGSFLTQWRIQHFRKKECFGQILPTESCNTRQICGERVSAQGIHMFSVASTCEKQTGQGRTLIIRPIKTSITSLPMIAFTGSRKKSQTASQNSWLSDGQNKWSDSSMKEEEHSLDLLECQGNSCFICCCFDVENFILWWTFLWLRRLLLSSFLTLVKDPRPGNATHPFWVLLTEKSFCVERFSLRPGAWRAAEKKDLIGTQSFGVLFSWFVWDRLI